MFTLFNRLQIQNRKGASAVDLQTRPNKLPARRKIDQTNTKPMLKKLRVRNNGDDQRNKRKKMRPRKK
jgi:prophage DNA circulation protein